MTEASATPREGARDVVIEPAWRRSDPALEAAAAAFWQRLGILPGDISPEQRARELVAVARRGDEIIGVSTATIDDFPPLKARMAFLRAAVDPAHRRSHAGIALGVGSREIIERWAATHREERVGGLVGVIENRLLGPPLLEPVWPTTRLALVGFTPEGLQVRAYWFPHFRFSESAEQAPRRSAEPSPDLEVRKAWRRDDPQIESDVVAYWNRLGLLPAEVDPQTRAKEVIAAAYQDGELIAVSTATIEKVDFLRARFAILRGSTDPEHRRSHAQLALAEPSREALEEWALANPDEQLAGGLAVVARSEWGGFIDLPVWPQSKLMVFSHLSDGRQIRARWFDHYRLPTAEG